MGLSCQLFSLTSFRASPCDARAAGAPGVTCSIIFKDPTGRSVYSREVLPADTEGKVAHMTASTGEYQVCISCASSKWFNTQLLKWSLSIELGDTDISIDVSGTYHSFLEMKFSREVIISRASKTLSPRARQVHAFESGLSIAAHSFRTWRRRNTLTASI